MRTKACATVAVVILCSCALLGYTSASDSPAGAPLANVVPRITATPTDDAFTSPLPTPTPSVTPTHDPFTSPLPTPTLAATPPYPYTATASPIPLTPPCTSTSQPPPPTVTPTGSPTAAPTPTATPTGDPFTSPLPTTTPVAWPSPTPESAFKASPTPTSTGSPTPSPTPTWLCPYPTPEPLWVDPILSPTDRFSQTIVVYAGNSEAITVTAESGIFAAPGGLSAHVPVLVTVDLLPDVTHHLRVYSRVRRFEFGGCVYGGYTLSTITDRYGEPLTIVQQVGGQTAHTVWLPLVLKTQGLLVPWSSRLPVDRECLPPAECAY